MSTWSNKEVLFFLEAYHANSTIWDPRDKNHKDKKKVADAWNRLSEVMKRPVKELKNKKEILMTTFRKTLKKKQDAIRSGSGADEIYEPTWFAYPLMESFLLPRYSSKMGINWETQSITPQPEACEIEIETEEEENHIILEDFSPSTTAGVNKSSAKKFHHRFALEHTAEKQMATAFSQLTNALKEEDDECDLYAKLLAKKLRQLPSHDRKIMMYEIDGLFIKEIHRNIHFEKS